MPFLPSYVKIHFEGHDEEKEKLREALKNMKTIVSSYEDMMNSDDCLLSEEEEEAKKALSWIILELK